MVKSESLLPLCEFCTLFFIFLNNVREPLGASINLIMFFPLSLFAFHCTESLFLVCKG